jgi:YesN/AraC family two-component response regulator
VRQGLDCALSGQAALDKLDGCIGQQIILLVSDINMPGMSGLDLIPKVKARRPDLPVFMISAYGDAERVKEALERGASKFVTKPVDFQLAACCGAAEGGLGFAPVADVVWRPVPITV